MLAWSPTHPLHILLGVYELRQSKNDKLDEVRYILETSSGRALGAGRRFAAAETVWWNMCEFALTMNT